MYRHSLQAQSTDTVCTSWQKKQCTNQCCPLRHPGSKELAITNRSNKHTVLTNLTKMSPLEKKGQFFCAKPDFRPLTDCTFYIQGKQCRNGDMVRLAMHTGKSFHALYLSPYQCAYRHSDKARLTEKVCVEWQMKQCSNRSCPLRHPVRMHSSRKGSNSNGKSPVILIIP